MMTSVSFSVALVLATVGIRSVAGISLDINDPASIRSAASTIAKGLLSFYDTAAGTGILPEPYYWWESGEMWGGLVDYWHYTNDASFNDIVSQGLLANIGPARDFIVPDQAWDEGNDDQAFWGFASMTAAEIGFPEPPSSIPSWLQLTENLWNNQLTRWDTSSCNGGLKWQIYTSNKGYDYKNSVSNGAFFQLAARLARFTGNQTYMDWALKTWDWTEAVGLISPGYLVWDGTDDTVNCATIDHTQWTYNAGLYMLGAAALYNYTNGSPLWEQRTTGLVEATSIFFSPFSNATGIMYEAECELKSICNPDQYSFKAYLSRAMYKTTQLAPYTHDAINTVLRPSAQGAASSCVGDVSLGGASGSTCGSRWFINGFDNVYGVGQQLSAMEVIQGLLIDFASPPSFQSNVVIDTSTPAIAATSTIVAPTRTSVPLQVTLTTAAEGTATYKVGPTSLIVASSTPTLASSISTGPTSDSSPSATSTSDVVASGSMTTSIVSYGSLTTSSIASAPSTAGSITPESTTMTSTASRSSTFGAALFTSSSSDPSGFTTSVLGASSFTTSAFTTAALSTSAFTTAALSTSALTTAALTTAALTSAALSTSALSTAVLSTTALTTIALGTTAFTTVAVSTAALTSAALTTSALTASAFRTASAFGTSAFSTSAFSMTSFTPSSLASALSTLVSSTFSTASTSASSNPLAVLSTTAATVTASLASTPASSSAYRTTLLSTAATLTAATLAATSAAGSTSRVILSTAATVSATLAATGAAGMAGTMTGKSILSTAATVMATLAATGAAGRFAASFGAAGVVMAAGVIVGNL